ncbi:hypothetical protein [Streptomyces sp. Tu 3180]|uniref:hypothetical protein n=1 Tax=Streptomyces sp. Tu 3180 TaxID=2682611 RepID=UPI001359B28D|nr:hypothetical protein [Streptomyces sp. Tu 3180]KAF3465842.1 hypothetical protein GL259_16885 [Streptomyces sp. Tu 3180]
MAPWPPVRGCALLALTFGGGAGNGVRLTVVVVMVFVLFGSFSQVFDATAPERFVDAALRVAGGVPVVVLLFLSRSTAWFDRER